MDNLLSLAQSISENPERIINYIAMFTFLSTIFMVVKILLMTWAVYDCWKNEKDLGRRNLWVAVILVGRLTGSLVYLVLEKIMSKKGEKNGTTFTNAA
ncbi:MAG: hypothetical protein Fur0012_00880 [Elusimicrobiota bacterium]